MQKIISICCILIICVTSAQAQEKNKHSVDITNLAIRMGYNYSIVTSSLIHADCKDGVNFGTTADLTLSNKFAFRSGIYYSMKGYKEQFGEIKWKFNYLELPVLAVNKIRIVDNFGVEFQVGPYFAFCVYGDNNKELYKTYCKRFDWGVNAGLGFNIYHFYIGATYDFGVWHIVTHGLNQCIMANVGYAF